MTGSISQRSSLTIGGVPLLGKHKGVKVDLQWAEREDTLNTDPPRLSTERTVLGFQTRRKGSVEVQCGPNDPLGESVILKDSVQDFLLLVVVSVGERFKLLIQVRKHVMRFVRVLLAFLVFGESKSAVIRSEKRDARENV